MQSFGPQDGIDISGGDSNEVRRSGAAGRNRGFVAADTTGWSSRTAMPPAPSATACRCPGGLVEPHRQEPGRSGGIPCCGNVGIAVAGNDNVIRGNLVREWNAGNIVLVPGREQQADRQQAVRRHLPPARPAEWAQNGDGLFVGAFTAGTVVRGNTANGNEGDGIEVRGTGTTIADNTANENGDFGIDAVAGVTDGGGNLASGNGNALQCRNVFCQ